MTAHACVILDVEKAAQVLREYYCAARDADEGGPALDEADWVPRLEECLRDAP